MKSKIAKKALLFSIVAVTSVCLVPSFVNAKAEGVCSDCHTMHNSQDGDTMFGDATAYGALTNGGCVGCHTGTNDGGNIPYVMSSTADYGTNGIDGDTLAGGNFRWVSEGSDTMGHNVLGIVTGQDPNMPSFAPPGWNDTFTDERNNAISDDDWATQLNCAGANGCHGDHTATNDWDAVSGSHHADDSAILGTSVANSFRFLDGILGLEDSDWEFQPNAASEHNQYFGVDKTSDLLDGTTDKQTISYLCAQCHGNFHSGAGNLGAVDVDAVVESPWIRHPTDYDMGNVQAKDDYKGYGVEGVHTYNLVAPVGSEVVTAVLGTVYNSAGDAIVTCISCHRAHGTPNDDLLRWNYDTCNSGTDNSLCGCFECHTTKDAG